MGHRSRMQPVELLDDVRAPDGPAARPRPEVRHRRRRLLWSAVVVVVLALVGTQVAFLTRDRAAIERIQALPGVARGLDANVSELWRVDERDVEFLDRSVSVAGLLVGVRTLPDGSQRIEARAARTGASRWSAPLRGPDPVLAERGGSSTRSACESVPSEPGHDQLVACLGSDAVVSIGNAGRTTFVRLPERSHVVVLDAADGRVVADQPGPRAVEFMTLPGLVVLGMPGDDGHAELTAQDLVTGALAWSYTSPAPGISAASDLAGFRLFRLGHRVGIQEVRRQVTLLSAAGEVVRDRTRVLDGAPMLVGPDRLELVTGFAAATPTTTIVRPGQPDREIPGYLLARSVDDGSLGDVEITYGSIVQGWDARTGERLWVADGPVGGPAVVLDGTVYCLGGEGGGSVLALDGRTGSVLWRVGAGTDGEVRTLLTDGTSLVVASSPSPGQPVGTLDAFDLDSGSRLWRTTTPALAGVVSVRAGLILARSGAWSAVLGSPSTDAGQLS